MWGRGHWKAKDYFNGLDVGSYLVKDRAVGQALKDFSCGDFMRFWALLPASTRDKQQDALKERIKGNEYGWMENYEDAKAPLRTLILAGLEMTLAPRRFLGFFAPPPSRLTGKYRSYLDDIREGRRVPQEDYGFWVWAAAKFYQEAGCNAWIFVMRLDMNYTEKYGELGLRYGTGTVLGLTGRTLTKLLEQLGLKEIAVLCCVSKGWRRAIWMCFFDYAPTRYQKTGESIKVIWA